MRRRLSVHSWELQFFFFLRRGEGMLFPCSQCVPMMFPWCSYQLTKGFPKLFPKMFTIVCQMYLIWFAQSSTLMYMNWKRSDVGEHICFYFATGASIGGVPKCSKIWANQYGSFGKKTKHKSKKKWEHTHELTCVLLVQRHHVYTPIIHTLQLSDLSSSLSHSFQLQHSDSLT